MIQIGGDFYNDLASAESEYAEESMEVDTYYNDLSEADASSPSNDLEPQYQWIPVAKATDEQWLNAIAVKVGGEPKLSVTFSKILKKVKDVIASASSPKLDVKQIDAISKQVNKWKSDLEHSFQETASSLPSFPSA